MRDLTRRNKPTPVQAVRKPPDQVVVDAPGGTRGPAQPAPQQTPSAQPHVTQNFFYISAPAAPVVPPTQAQQTSPPQEIHYHTTVQHAPIRLRGRRRSLSFFGAVGVVLGALSFAALYVPQVKNFSLLMALAGLVAAGLGLLVSILFGNSGAAIPVFGLLVSGAACLAPFVVMRTANDGAVDISVHVDKKQLEDVAADQKHKAQEAIEMAKAAVSSVTAGAPMPEPAAPKAASPKPAAQSKEDTSVFNFEKNAATPTEAATPAQPRAVVDKPAIDPAAAKEKLETQRLAAAKRLGIDYPAARSNAEDAWAALQTARNNFAAGSPELTMANQKWLDARAFLEAMLRRLRADPAVSAAEKSLNP